MAEARSIKVCPHCGCALAGNIMRCPTCANYVSDEFAREN